MKVKILYFIIVVVGITFLSGCLGTNTKSQIGQEPQTNESEINSNYRITTFVYDEGVLQYVATPKGIFNFTGENITADLRINPLKLTFDNVPMYALFKKEYIFSDDCPIDNELEGCIRRVVSMAQRVTDDTIAIEENRILREAELNRLDTEKRVTKILIDVKGINYNAAKETIIKENCENALKVSDCIIEATKIVFAN